MKHVFEWCRSCQLLADCYPQHYAGPCYLEPACQEGPHVEQPQRAPELQSFIDNMAHQLHIDNSFIESCEHPYNCRCPKCLEWWRTIDPDEDSYGPFSVEKIES